MSFLDNCHIRTICRRPKNARDTNQILSAFGEVVVVVVDVVVVVVVIVVVFIVRLRRRFSRSRV